ncbi:hypothetical protein BHE74_00053115 [Ensete ventricosum]|nr:hypothetical protein BHE74_00053115 [Ensete ventricosum]
MILNRVESFYALLLHFRNEGSEEGRPATVSPHAGSATHGQADYKGQPATTKAPYKGGRPRPKPLAGAAPTARPQGAAPRPGLPPARATAPVGAAPAQGGTIRPLGAA